MFHQSGSDGPRRPGPRCRTHPLAAGRSAKREKKGPGCCATARGRRVLPHQGSWVLLSSCLPPQMSFLGHQTLFIDSILWFSRFRDSWSSAIRPPSGPAVPSAVLCGRRWSHRPVETAPPYSTRASICTPEAFAYTSSVPPSRRTLRRSLDAAFVPGHRRDQSNPLIIAQGIG